MPSAVPSSGSPLVQRNLGYDAASRFLSVTTGTNSATYSYLDNSPLVGQIFFRNGNGLRMTTTKSYDFLNRLTAISSVPSASSVVNFGYSYNNANQRTSRSETGGSYWNFSYDSLGQVTSGHKYFYDNKPVLPREIKACSGAPVLVDIGVWAISVTFTSSGARWIDVFTWGWRATFASGSSNTSVAPSSPRRPGVPSS